MRDVGAQLGFLNSVIVTPQGIGGGLVLFSKQSVQLLVLSASANLIDCNVLFNGIQFYYTFVYGHPNLAFRHHTWERLTRIGTTRRNQPWFLLGDFNEILGNHEKAGGRLRPESSFHQFRQLMRTCDYTDLPTIGNRFSWVGQRGTHQVECCLDRTMATAEWFDIFPASQTEFLEIGESDHRPLITYISADREVPRRQFRFDSRMLDKDGFKALVFKGWTGTGQAQLVQIPLVQRLSRCRQHISLWKKHNRNNTEEKISSLRSKLDKAMVDQTVTAQERRGIKEDLNQAYLEEEIYWKQKSRVMWLRAGDRNTSYFHAVTKATRSRNNIGAIQDDNGVIHRGHKNIARVAENYFQSLYASEETDQNTYNTVFNGFQSRVSEDMNRDLTRAITEEEVLEAILDIGPHKAPGPDGFTAVFYHKLWEDLKPEVMKEIKDFFDRDYLDPQINHTNLCLIPKIYPPTGMKEFRPIALCNVSYKIISKILVNRLKKHLDSIISENQNAFIPGRMISDNIVVAHEIFHSLKARKRQATSYMAIKTDITKAYDGLEWVFLKRTMEEMGFDEKWVGWIMACITTVRYSVLINGAPKGYITTERGLRQGDPLSPYLFILCAEVLSHMMNKAKLDRSLLGVKISNQAPPVNHLLFADDSLFFSLSNVKAARKLKDIFHKYEVASGQAINLSKSSITFGNKVLPGVRTRMRNILGIHNEGGIGKYLGLPEQFGSKKGEMFAYIVEMVKAVTQSWKQKYLSQGGKEVLLKAIAMAMPIFSMNIFRLPKEICEDINRILAQFWWGADDRKGLHWYSWKRISVPKREGGLGFRDLEIFNQALLSKQVWRIMQKPNCLMSRVLKARYFPDGDILKATLKKKASYRWKSILHGRDLITKGLRYIIGDGSHVNMWKDPWIPDHPPRAPRPRQQITQDTKVSQFFLRDRNQWDIEKLRQEVIEEDVDKILALKISPTAKQDLLGWHYNDNGIYSVKSGYWLGSHLPGDNQPIPTYGNVELKAKIWKTKAPAKLKHFLWRLLT